VALAEERDEVTMLDAVRAGAVGYLLKTGSRAAAPRCTE